MFLQASRERFRKIGGKLKGKIGNKSSNATGQKAKSGRPGKGKWEWEILQDTNKVHPNNPGHWSALTNQVHKTLERKTPEREKRGKIS